MDGSVVFIRLCQVPMYTTSNTCFLGPTQVHIKQHLDCFIHFCTAHGRESLYLHWLPIHYRILFKIATLSYKTLATCQPSYLYNLLQVYHPSRAQPDNFSMYHICLLILVGALSATALLQHVTPFLSPLKTVRPYIVSSAT